jgi:23S rRNA (uracil1939-C5)-methyltransferase
VRGYFNRVFDLSECFLQSPQTGSLVAWVRDWCRQSGLPAYTTKDHRGFWRFLVIREGKCTDQTLVHLITSEQGDSAAVEALGAALRGQFPAITSFVHSVSGKKAQVAVAETSRIFWGPGHIEERLGDLTLRVSVNAFLQTNTLAAEGLYAAVARLGEFTGTETVWDLYCGAGSIALWLAPQVRRVVGFELVPEAVADAYVNCDLNGIDNCRFVAGDLKDQIRMASGGPKGEDRPDVVVTDPPRSGLHPQVIDALKELAPGRIITVSCNPATLARDLALLADAYEVRSIQPFDLFPHTAHIECVALLNRRQSLPG